MTAVLTVRSGGSVVGACGKRCHDAEHDDCACICCSLNHGVGFEQAVINARAHYEQWLADARADGWPIDTYELGLPVIQHALF